MKLDIEEIRTRLPHRYPFLLVDRVVLVEPGERIEAYKNLTINEPFFDGHFPGKAVFPGVLLLEAMAQAAGILGFVTMDKTPADGSIYYFVGADNLRFKRPCALVTLEADQLCNRQSHRSTAIHQSSRPVWQSSHKWRRQSCQPQRRLYRCHARG